MPPPKTVSSSRRHEPTELRVTKGVPVALICQQATVCGTRSLRGDHHTIAMPIYALVYLGQKPLFIEGDLGKQNNVGPITPVLSRQSARAGNPTGMPAHDFKNKYLSRRGAHGLNIQRRLAG